MKTTKRKNGIITRTEIGRDRTLFMSSLGGGGGGRRRGGADSSSPSVFPTLNSWDFRAKISQLFPKFYRESFDVHFTAPQCNLPKVNLQFLIFPFIDHSKHSNVNFPAFAINKDNFVNLTCKFFLQSQITEIT